MPAKKPTPKPDKGKTVATLRHDAKRKNLPTAEYESLMRQEDKSPIQVAYERRNRDLDPQLVWRGKDNQDWSDLVAPAPPLYIQEKVHPKVLIDDLLRQSKARAIAAAPQIDLFSDFNGLPKDARATEFYQHDANWSNRMILGDSLQVMASLAEREGLRGKVQCIYFDPPYGIKFNSNFQWSTTSRDVKDGNADHITREPEQVKAFRDTWRDGIHSYLTYLRDRLTVARDLLADAGSIFVQIGDENVHRVRMLMDELFGEDNFVSDITVKKTSASTEEFLTSVTDYLLCFARNKPSMKFRRPLVTRGLGDPSANEYRHVVLSDSTTRPMTDEEFGGVVGLPADAKAFRPDNLTSSHEYSLGLEPFTYRGRTFVPGSRYWSTSPEGLRRLASASRLLGRRNDLAYLRYLDDYPVLPASNV
jgi:adenine-specific DNA-methyltransferase